MSAPQKSITSDICHLKLASAALPCSTGPLARCCLRSPHQGLKVRSAAFASVLQNPGAASCFGEKFLPLEGRSSLSSSLLCSLRQPLRALCTRALSGQEQACCCSILCSNLLLSTCASNNSMPPLHLLVAGQQVQGGMQQALVLLSLSVMSSCASYHTLTQVEHRAQHRWWATLND